MLCRSIVFVMTLAGVTCGATAQAPPPTTASKQPAARKLALSVQEVTLARPLDVVVSGAKRSVRSVTEFRVSSSDPLPVRARPGAGRRRHACHRLSLRKRRPDAGFQHVRAG